MVCKVATKAMWFSLMSQLDITTCSQYFAMDWYIFFMQWPCDPDLFVHLHTYLDNVAKFHGCWLRNSSRKPCDKNLLTDECMNELTELTCIIGVFGKLKITALILHYSFDKKN